MAFSVRVGIPMRLELSTGRFYLGRDYCEALAAFGAVPLHLPLIPDRELISAAVSGLDGVLLPGSDSDIDPALYGEEPHPNFGPVVPEKDKTDLLILEECETRNIPVFAICFGMQSMNVSRGGSLIQDIASQIGDPVKHEQGTPRDRHSHSITLEKGSLIAELAGNGAEKGKVRVNSHHHQAVKTLGRDLKATAFASDGVIEAVEDTRDGKFAVGVQWHPEIGWQSDDFSRSMFERFVKVCSEQIR